MPWKKHKNVDYVGKWYRIMYRLEGKEIFRVYNKLFPGMPEYPKSHYKILKDQKKRMLMFAISDNSGLSLEDIAEKTGLNKKDVRKRIKFFEGNGMKRVE